MPKRDEVTFSVRFERLDANSRKCRGAWEDQWPKPSGHSLHSFGKETGLGNSMTGMSGKNVETAARMGSATRTVNFGTLRELAKLEFGNVKISCNSFEKVCGL